LLGDCTIERFHGETPIGSLSVTAKQTLPS
jgi:hypothetical protein